MTTLNEAICRLVVRWDEIDLDAKDPLQVHPNTKLLQVLLEITFKPQIFLSVGNQLGSPVELSNQTWNFYKQGAIVFVWSLNYTQKMGNSPKFGTP